MKKFSALFLLMITLSGLAGFPHPSASARTVHNIQMATKTTTDKTVYIGANKTYHRSCCRHMSYSKPINLTKAQKKNYTPCKTCRP